MYSVLHTRGWSLPDIRSRGRLYAGSDRPILPDAARSSQQRYLLDPSDRVTLVLLKHREQYPFAMQCHRKTEQPSQMTVFASTLI